MIAFVSCILCWIIGLIMGSDIRITQRLLEERIALHEELRELKAVDKEDV